MRNSFLRHLFVLITGVILQTYGSGNVPTARKDLLNIYKQATEEHGIIILNITQCWKGSVRPIYATGAILKEYGVIPGFVCHVLISLSVFIEPAILFLNIC